MNIKSIFNTLLIAITVVSCNQTLNSQNGASVINIDGSKLTEMAKDSNTIIIDVRTPGEVAEGYIPGAKLFMDYNGGKFDAAYKTLDTSKTYIVYCRSGMRSSNASNQMIQSGFKKVYNLSGGINNWSGPVKKD
jgi:rhodanese-related sulfurtransferase